VLEQSVTTDARTGGKLEGNIMGRTTCVCTGGGYACLREGQGFAGPHRVAQGPGQSRAVPAGEGPGGHSIVPRHSRLGTELMRPV